MSTISPKAEVSPKAKIGKDCIIYPFVYIEDDVVIGDGCVIYPFVSILNGTRMGNNNSVYQGSVIAAVPQDVNYKGEPSEVVIGDNNTFRENVVINRATYSTGKTVIGNSNYLMEGAHVSHDTKIGDNCTLGYSVKIAGDCVIGNGVIFSSGVLQDANTRVGDRSMIQAGTRFNRDVPPYIVAGGNPVNYNGITSPLLTVDGIEEKTQKHIANAYRLIFHGQTSVFDSIIQVKEQVPYSNEIGNIIDFVSATKRGIISKK